MNSTRLINLNNSSYATFQYVKCGSMYLILPVLRR